MTRDEFLRRLRAGLAGLAPEEIDDIVADYAAHFAAAEAEGRDEAEVAAALGDPRRLARELKLEAGIRRWREARSPSAAAAAIFAFLGLGALDILVLLPILAPLIVVIVALYCAMAGVLVGGAAILVAGPFAGFPGGVLAAILGGAGLMAAAIAVAALLTVVSIWLINALLWFGRLHYRVLKPAIDPEA